MLNFCDFIQVYVFSTNHHLNETSLVAPIAIRAASFWILSNSFFLVLTTIIQNDVGIF